MNNEHIGNNIKQYRKKKGMTQEELGKIVGVSAQAVSKWECGGIPDLPILISLAELFNISLDEMIGRESSSFSSVQDGIYKTLSMLPMNERFEKATEYCFEIFKTLTGMPNIKNREMLEGSEGHEANRARVRNDDGCAYFMAEKNNPVFLLFPEPKEGFREMLGDISDFHELFVMLSDDDALKLLVFLYSRKETLLSSKAASQGAGISEAKAKQLLQEFENIGWVRKESADLDEGNISLYKSYNKEFVLYLLWFAHEALINPKYWMLSSFSKRTKPIFY